MNTEVWHKIFKKYVNSYRSIRQLFFDGIIEGCEMDKLLSKLLEEIITTMDSEVKGTE